MNKVEISDNILKYILKNVYFINGTAYAGKSTMVAMLGERFDGIVCGENYNDALMDAVDPVHQPNLGYFQTMSGWQEFISRTPEDYDAWLDGCAREAGELELLILVRLAQNAPDRPIFADTNLSPALLHRISDTRHVAIMTAPQEMSVSRFFDRPDAEKQFIYQRILEAPDPDAALAHYRRILAYANRDEKRLAFENSGFFVYRRREDSTLEEAFAAVAGHFGFLGSKH